MACTEPQRPNRQVVNPLLLLEDLRMCRTENPETAADGRGSGCTPETRSILITSQPTLRRDPRARTTEEAEALPHHLSVLWGQGF